MINVTRTEKNIIVKSEYHPSLPHRAKQLSGKWDGLRKEWVFPIQAENEVKSLYMDIYGDWSDIIQKYVDILCEAENGTFSEKSSITLGGRIIARAFDRDSGAKIGNGVIVLEGDFDSGGSRKNWTTFCKNGTKFKVLNVPEIKAKELVNDPEWCTKISIIDDTDDIDREKLIEEKKKIEKRLKEIENLLRR